MKKLSLRYVGAVAAALAVPATGSAHFVWAILPATGSSVAIQFAESPGDSVIPSFAGKAESTRAWDNNQTPVALTLGETDLTGAVGESNLAVAAAMTYGIYDGGDRLGKFLLRYYAKAARNEAGAGIRMGLVSEIVLNSATDGVYTFTVYRNLTPVPNAEVTYFLADSKTAQKGHTGPDGTFTIAHPTVGQLSILAVAPEDTAGSWNHLNFRKVRHYTSLTLPVGAAQTAAPER